MAYAVFLVVHDDFLQRNESARFAISRAVDFTIQGISLAIHAQEADKSIESHTQMFPLPVCPGSRSRGFSNTQES